MPPPCLSNLSVSSSFWPFLPLCPPFLPFLPFTCPSHLFSLPLFPLSISLFFLILSPFFLLLLLPPFIFHPSMLTSLLPLCSRFSWFTLFPSYQPEILSPSPFWPFLFLLSLFPYHTLSSLPLTFSLRFLFFCLSLNHFKLLSDLYFESSSFFLVIYHPPFLFSPSLFFVPLPFNTSFFTTFLKHHYCPSWSFSFVLPLRPLLFIWHLPIFISPPLPSLLSCLSSFTLFSHFIQTLSLSLLLSLCVF